MSRQRDFLDWIVLGVTHSRGSPSLRGDVAPGIEGTTRTSSIFLVCAPSLS